MRWLNNVNSRGLFFVIYGANNLGKSEQVRRLGARLVMEQNQVIVIKYPIYKLEPTGPKINSILRNPDDPDRNLPELEFQKLYAQNRRDFQQTVVQLLNAGINVIAEDYTGTGLSWGLTRDVNLDELEDINKDLLVPDLAILLDGERFAVGVEKGHRNESDADKVWKKNRNMHLLLADKFNWLKVNANQTMEEVHNDIISIVHEKFSERNLIKTT